MTKISGPSKPKPPYEVERKGDEQPHFLPHDPEGGCMGQGSGGYWRQFVNASNGEIVGGTGNTPEEAIKDASENRKKREAWISADPREVIKLLTSTSMGCRGTQEQNDFNRAVAKILGIIS
jgi:hypothetical protein